MMDVDINNSGCNLSEKKNIIVHSWKNTYIENMSYIKLFSNQFSHNDNDWGQFNIVNRRGKNYLLCSYLLF